MSTPQEPRRDGLEEAIRRQRESLDTETPRADLWAGIADRLSAEGSGLSGSAETQPAPTHTEHSNQGPKNPERTNTGPLATEPTAIEPPATEKASGKIRSLNPRLGAWMRVAAVLAILTAAGLWLTQSGAGADSGQGSSAAVAAIENSSSNLPPEDDVNPRYTELRNMATRYERLVDRRGESILQNPALGPEESEIALTFLADLETDYRALLDEWAAGADPDKVMAAMVRNYRQRIELLENLSELLEPRPAPQKDDRYEDAIIL